MSAVKAADTELRSARKALDTANAELSSRKTESEKAQKAYIAALADYEIFRNRAEMSQVHPDPVTEQTPSVEAVETAAYKEAAPGEAQNTSKTTQSTFRTTQSTSGPTAKETAPVATGDTSNVMGWLAGLLASTGLMAFVFRRRKEAKVKDVQ